MRQSLKIALIFALAFAGTTAVNSFRKPVPAHAQFNVGRNFNCVVAVSTATSLTAVGGDCAAPPKDQSIYVTSLTFSTNAGAIAADSYNTLKYGTGGTCGTGTAIWWSAMTIAATQTSVSATFPTPIQIPAGNELCWINSTAGSKTLNIQGFIR